MILLPPIPTEDDLKAINRRHLPRESARHYISLSDEEISGMLKGLGLKHLSDLFQDIPEKVRFENPPHLPQEKGYQEAEDHLKAISEKNNRRLSFIGDGLPDWKVQSIISYVSDLRKLTTSYTPYQPERSQGTLITHWLYQCALSKLTGFEAINASLYDRSTALFEACQCSVRAHKKGDTVLISEAIYPGDREVLETMIQETRIRIEYLPTDENGQTDLNALKAKAKELGEKLAAVAFPQVNTYGLLENVDALTDTARSLGAKVIAMIDPMHLAPGGLKPPSEFGELGADIIVGEAQHLAIDPNFGGPGLGIFGVRYNENEKSFIRMTPGRFVGKAKDSAGRDCYTLVLSAREQHIRKDKATSNICSNQAFLATLAGAALLERGDAGLEESLHTARTRAHEAVKKLTAIEGVQLAFPNVPFLNEVVLKIPGKTEKLIEEALHYGVHVGVDMTDRMPKETAATVKLSFSDHHSEDHVGRLVALFENIYGHENAEEPATIHDLPAEAKRAGQPGIPKLGIETLKDTYFRLSELNISPDHTCYPLGSCTMKYNPRLNDWAAGLPGFTRMHPQAPIQDVQGCLEVLYETQEWFKQMTGLPGVTTQPVAGAQGELVGIKLFQAYHRANGESNRDVILVPKSAHGTNFATAIVAGYENKMVDGKPHGVVLLEADPTGRINLEDLDQKLSAYGNRVSGIMVTNPNTGGVFENHFKEIADKVHASGGLVYMDGANLNAIASWINLGKMGVDAVHSNLHKTFTIPHGGGGPGDAIVAVSEKLVDFLPGYQIHKEDGTFAPVKPKKSIGSFHRHWGNFAHKVRCYAYLIRLGEEGLRRMSAVAVLCSRYWYQQLREHFPTLPKGAADVPRMHEFIITLSEEDFKKIEAAGIPRAQIIPRVGKLFLDYGYHAPTVAFPEVYGLMLEPTESYTKEELDRLVAAMLEMKKLIQSHPQILQDVPYFTPIDRVDETAANRNLTLSEPLDPLPPIQMNRVHPKTLIEEPVETITQRLLEVLKEKEAQN